MNSLQLVTSDVAQKLALMNAAVELRDALEGFLPLARKERDELLSMCIWGDDISTGQRLLNERLVLKAAEWNDRVLAGEAALAKSKGGLP